MNSVYLHWRLSKEISEQCVMIFFKMLEDPVQGQRIKVVIDGVTDSAGTAYDGLLGIN